MAMAMDMDMDMGKGKGIIEILIREAFIKKGFQI